MEIGSYSFEGSKYSIRKPLDILDDILSKDGGWYFVNTLLEYTDNWDFVRLTGEYYMQKGIIRFRINPMCSIHLAEEYGEDALFITMIADNVTIEPTDENMYLLENTPNIESYVFFRGEDATFKTFYRQDADAPSFGELIDYFEYFDINTYKKLEQLSKRVIETYKKVNNVEDNPFEVDTSTIDTVVYGVDLLPSPVIYENKNKSVAGVDIGSIKAS